MTGRKASDGYTYSSTGQNSEPVSCCLQDAGNDWNRIMKMVGNVRRAACLKISCKEFFQQILKLYTGIQLRTVDSVKFPTEASDIPASFGCRKWESIPNTVVGIKILIIFRSRSHLNRFQLGTASLRAGRANLLKASLGSSPGQFMWDLLCTKWNWSRFSPNTSVSPANSHSTDCSTFIMFHPGLVQ
jgi:hypothetical protein